MLFLRSPQKAFPATGNRADNDCGRTDGERVSLRADPATTSRRALPFGEGKWVPGAPCAGPVPLSA